MSAPRWTLEHCRRAASGCATRTEFFRRFKPEYAAAHRRGWLNEVCAHMPTHVRGTRNKWSLTKAIAKGAEYDDFAEFRLGNSVLYSLVCQRGWLERVTGHMRRKRAANHTWTKGACADAAQSFETRSEFMRGRAGAYDAACRNGWLDEICEHMQMCGNRATRAIYIIRATGLRLAYIGLSFDPLKRYERHARKATTAMAAVLALPHTLKIVTKFVPTAAAARLERAFVRRFKAAGWKLANENAGGQPGGSQKKWTKTTLQKLANAMKTRGQMMRAHLGAYCVACNDGLLDELFANHPNRGFGDGPIRDWDRGRLQKIADRCSSRNDMKSRFDRAWQAANRRGLLDDLFRERDGGRAYEVWTTERIWKEARLASTATELRRDHPKAWKAAYRRGLLKELFPSHP